MASGLDSNHPDGSSANKLNSAISDFAASFVKRELQQLTQDCNEALGRIQVPKLCVLLAEVDKERQVFDDAKNKMLQDLRRKLETLEVDNGVIDSVIADLQKMNPAYFDLIPSASILNVSPSTPAKQSSESQLSSLGESVDIEPTDMESADVESVGIGIDLDGPPSPPDMDYGEVAGGEEHVESASGTRRSSQTRRDVVDHALQEQLAAETSQTRIRNSQKRSRDDAFDYQLDIKGASNECTEMAEKTGDFPTIETKDIARYECIFRHSGYDGYYIIRCDHDECSDLRFTDPPLLYRRAVKHFEKMHSDDPFTAERLTDNEVFLKYAVEVKGVESAPREWFNEHISFRSHKFTPRKSSNANLSPSPKRIQTEPNHNKWITSTWEAPSASGEGFGAEQDSNSRHPRRHLRRKPRQDYVELVTGKPSRANTFTGTDASRASRSFSNETETEASGTPKPSAPSKSPSVRFKFMYASKPFGYFEEWPRRSAPR